MKPARYVLGATVTLMSERETLLLTVRNEVMDATTPSLFGTVSPPVTRRYPSKRRLTACHLTFSSLSVHRDKRPTRVAVVLGGR